MKTRENIFSIIRHSDELVTENFRMSEFYSQSVPAPVSHPLDSRLIQAVQFIRNWSDSPIEITSSYRTALHQMALIAQGATSTQLSYHMTGQAIDFKFLGDEAEKIHARFCNDVLKRGNLFIQLRHVYGIQGFGLYSTFIHLDTGEKEGLHKDVLGTFRLWDYRKKKA